MTKQITFQSGSRLGFSTETALVALVDEQWQNWDGCGASIFVLLDLAMVFNTIKHSILLSWFYS